MEKPKISKKKVKLMLGKVSKHERHQGSKEMARRREQIAGVDVEVIKDKLDKYLNE